MNNLTVTTRAVLTIEINTGARYNQTASFSSLKEQVTRESLAYLNSMFTSQPKGSLKIIGEPVIKVVVFEEG